MRRGELTMAEAELEWRISDLRSQMSSISEKIDSTLKQCSPEITEQELMLITARLTCYLSENRELSEQLYEAEQKQLAVLKLIRKKDETSSILHSRKDIFKKLNLEDYLIKHNRGDDYVSLSLSRANLILTASPNHTSDYDAVHGIVTAICFDGESVNLAKISLSELMNKQMT